MIPQANRFTLKAAAAACVLAAGLPCSGQSDLVRILAWDGLDAPGISGPFVFLNENVGTFSTPFLNLGINDDGLVWFVGVAKRPMGRTERTVYISGAGYGLTKLVGSGDPIVGPEGPTTIVSNGATALPSTPAIDGLGPVRISAVIEDSYDVGTLTTSQTVVLRAGPASSTEMVASNQLVTDPDGDLFTRTTDFDAVASPNGQHVFLVYASNLFNNDDNATIFEANGTDPGELIVKRSTARKTTQALVPGNSRIERIDPQIVVDDDGTLVFSGGWSTNTSGVIPRGQAIWSKPLGQPYELVLFNANRDYESAKLTDLEFLQPIGTSDDGRVFFQAWDQAGPFHGIFSADAEGLVEPILLPGEPAPGFPAGFTIASVLELRDNGVQPFENGAIQIRCEVFRPAGGALTTDLLLHTDGSIEPAVPFDAPVTFSDRTEGPYTLVGGSRIGPVIDGIITVRSTYTNATGTDTGELVARSDGAGNFTSLLATGDRITLPTETGEESVKILRIGASNFSGSFKRDRFNRRGESVWNVRAEGDRFALTVIGPPSSSCPADVNNDGSADSSDFFAWVQAFTSQAPECDVNRDGDCDASDFFAWVNAFGQGC